MVCEVVVKDSLIGVEEPFSMDSFRRASQDDYDNVKKEFFFARRSMDTIPKIATTNSVVQCQKLFLTTEVEMGLGPASTKVENEIYILHSSNAPFVTLKFADVWKANEGGDIQSVYRTLLMDCYLDGAFSSERVVGLVDLEFLRVVGEQTDLTSLPLSETKLSVDVDFIWAGESWHRRTMRCCKAKSDSSEKKDPVEEHIC
ncbi:hypothetical protein BJ878DRAFT_477300 [Calycina marina]|uniref:Uncharacterized protein n=1 Tax=Calycina marina TaxID=1763456 RepID=A0A9P8CJI9_9HELO|nr:hypothetical protein BJ878DRAFT_477300 [Calycina marina]